MLCHITPWSGSIHFCTGMPLFMQIGLLKCQRECQRENVRSWFDVISSFEISECVHATVFLWKHLVWERWQRIMDRLVEADRKSAVTQVITLYICGVQKSMSKCTTGQNVRWTGYKCRRHLHLRLQLKFGRKKNRQGFIWESAKPKISVQNQHSVSGLVSKRNYFNFPKYEPPINRI